MKFRAKQSALSPKSRCDLLFTSGLVSAKLAPNFHLYKYRHFSANPNYGIGRFK